MKITYNSQPPVENKYAELVEAIDKASCGEWAMIEVDDPNDKIRVRNTLYQYYRVSQFAVTTRFVRGYDNCIWVIKHPRPPEHNTDTQATP